MISSANATTFCGILNVGASTGATRNDNGDFFVLLLQVKIQNILILFMTIVKMLFVIYLIL